MQAPLAHAGHYLVSLLYLLPVVVLAAGVGWQRYRDRHSDLNDDGDGSANDSPPAEASGPL